jgi:hypothetical protein
MVNSIGKNSQIKASQDYQWINEHMIQGWPSMNDVKWFIGEIAEVNTQYSMI